MSYSQYFLAKKINGHGFLTMAYGRYSRLYYATRGTPMSTVTGFGIRLILTVAHMSYGLNS